MNGMEGMAVKTFAETGTVLQQTLVNLWNSFISVFPGLVAAIVLIVIGWLVGKIVGGAFSKLLKKVKLDYWVKKEKLSQALWGKEISSVLGSLIKWYIVIVFLGAAASLIQLQPLADFVSSVIHYLPALFGAIVVVIIGLVVGEYLKKSIRKTEMPYNEWVSRLVKFLVVYFTIVIGLQTAGFKVDILVDAFRIGFATFAITIAIIVGISFGLALKEDAKKIVKKLEKAGKSKKKKKSKKSKKKKK